MRYRWLRSVNRCRRPRMGCWLRLGCLGHCRCGFILRHSKVVRVPVRVQDPHDQPSTLGDDRAGGDAAVVVFVLIAGGDVVSLAAVPRMTCGGSSGGQISPSICPLPRAWPDGRCRGSWAAGGDSRPCPPAVRYGIAAGSGPRAGPIRCRSAPTCGRCRGRWPAGSL